MITNQKPLIYRFFVVLGEIAGLNLILLAMRPFFFEEMPQYIDAYGEFSFVLSICYFVCGMQTGSRLHHVFIRGDEILRRALYSNIYFDLLVITLSLALPAARLNVWKYLLPLLAEQLLFSLLFKKTVRLAIQHYRARRAKRRGVVVVGPIDDIHPLLLKLAKDKGKGYSLLGYFADTASEKSDPLVPLLGRYEDFEGYLDTHDHIVEVFCTLSSADQPRIRQLVDYCDNHLLSFIGLPSSYSFISHRIKTLSIDGISAVALQTSPLEDFDNAALKRTCDLIVSAGLLIFVFPFVYLIFGTLIKLSSPGPVFFRQKRSGLNGKAFYCYKFRSMRVNADSDSKQATEHDPRKTRIGDFMRRTNIDELPQLINVFLGDMSLVGPRPHMLKHTEEYSALIDKYMMRHFVRPGITGWAQVTGFRGETKELWQMEGRVKKDIWYIEHWNFALDLWIMIQTVLTIRSKNAY